MGERDTDTSVIHNNTAAAAVEKMSSQQSSSIGVNLRVTGQCSQGGRKYMEDFFSVAYQQSESSKDLEYAFVGIYDGHGGSEAATFAKEHLMMEIINQKLFWSDCDQDVLRAIREGYIATHYAMWREQEKWPKTATGLPSTAGTTATVAFIRREKIYIGHVGDSGIVLGYQNENENFWRAKQLTQDHKPESQAEKSRIIRSGGKVVVKSGVPRVVWNRPKIAGHKGPVRRNTPVDEIPFLAVARSLGDLWSYNLALNEFVVSPDPDVKVIKINPKTFRCLIFGTDGLWNVVSAQDAVDTVREKEIINESLTAVHDNASGSNSQWTNPSKGLVEKALKAWTSKKMRADNTSVVTVILYPPGTNIVDNSVNCQTHSYGLEYMQVNAEIPTHQDDESYARLANKYLPPEEYRNYVYDDDEDERGYECHSCVEQFYPTYMSEPPFPSATVPLQHHPLNDHHQQYDYYSRSEFVSESDTLAYLNTSRMEEEFIDDAEDEEADDDYDGDDDEMDVESPPVIVNDNLTYMNSFAESYNSLLTSSLEREDSTAITSSSSSSSESSNGSDATSYNSSYHNLDIQQQYDLEMEQHQYQQQCMSAEEGYSLTKLETRGEQQLRYNHQPTVTEKHHSPQTFHYDCETLQSSSVYNQYNSGITTNEIDYPQQAGPSSFAYGNDVAAQNCTVPSYLNGYQQNALGYGQNLEYSSLLQQELEEEKLVAIENSRREAALAAVQAEQLISLEVIVQPTVNECDELEEEEEVAADLDETIQINEVSSSVVESPVCCNATVDTDEDEVMPTSVKMVLEKKENNAATTNPLSSTNMITSLSILPNRSPQPHVKCVPNKSKTNFPNVPNENRATGGRNSLISLHAKHLQHHHHQIHQQQAVASSAVQRYEKRQLRSMAVDYTKRTLRSRNSLSKDMKAKSTATAKSHHSLRRSSVVSSAAAAVVVQNRLLKAKTASIIANVENHHNTNSKSTVSSLSPLADSPMAQTRSNYTAAINLRSRQVVMPLHTAVGGNTSSVVASASSSIQRQRRARNLGGSNTNSKCSTNNGSLKVRSQEATSLYSKSTRLQVPTAALALPQPQPKTISNSVTMTRARSMLSPKSVVSVFSKRTNLRNSGSGLGRSPVAAAIQTRNRVQKSLSR